MYETGEDNTIDLTAASVITLSSVQRKFGELIRYLILTEQSISLMESCTGGMLSSLVTDTEGASNIFRGSFVTYSNDVKVMCGVPEEKILRYGVYSEETAVEMAAACRRNLGADIGIGVTGTFGNIDPANRDSVPGEVYIAVMCPGDIITRKIVLPAGEGRFASKLIIADVTAGLLKEAMEI